MYPLRLLRCLSSHQQHNDRQDPHATRHETREARNEREWSSQREEEVWSDPSLILAEFGERARWRVSCLTNTLLANVSRPPTELHPSVWLSYCLVVVMCARLHEPSTLSPILGRRAVRAILPLVTASWWDSALAFMIMYSFFCCFTPLDASHRVLVHMRVGGADIFCKVATNVLLSQTAQIESYSQCKTLM